jgi:hypothetical protein
MSMFPTVPNSDLHQRDLPPPGADWEEIVRFAHKFDGYEHWEADWGCAVVANIALGMQSELPQLSLNELRSCLFFEARRYHHFGWDPEPVILDYIRDLVERIRTKVDAGITDGRDDPSTFRSHYEGAMAEELRRQGRRS